MDAAVADTINRMDAGRIARHLDLIDWFCQATPGTDWFWSNMAETFMSENATTNSDRAWLLGALAVHTPDVAFDGAPADADWDNIFSHLRSEILARRDPEIPHAGTAQTQRRVVV